MKQAEKSRYREVGLVKMNHLTPSLRQKSDEALLKQVEKLTSFQSASVIFIYVGQNFEINTRIWIDRWLMAGKRVAVPRVVGNGVMDAVEITSLKQLSVKKMGILEPDETHDALSLKEIDLVIVPNVVADRYGYRIGFGGGYYDRFLKKELFKTVMPVRKSLLVEQVPREKHDIIIDTVVTEDEIILCKENGFER